MEILATRTSHGMMALSMFQMLNASPVVIRNDGYVNNQGILVCSMDFVDLIMHLIMHQYFSYMYVSLVGLTVIEFLPLKSFGLDG